MKTDYTLITHSTVYLTDYIGIITEIERLPRENNINVFKLKIKKTEPLWFRIKNDVCTHFGWRTLGSFEITHGIISHE